jgi:hypothetical protein
MKVFSTDVVATKLPVPHVKTSGVEVVSKD